MTGGRTRVRFALVIGRPPICAAGATWTSRTTSASWAGRFGHTSVIDAAGAIYVIGGWNGRVSYNDVWVSTDKGAASRACAHACVARACACN